jgi:hypothetical protein
VAAACTDHRCSASRGRAGRRALSSRGDDEIGHPTLGRSAPRRWARGPSVERRLQRGDDLARTCRTRSGNHKTGVGRKPLALNPRAAGATPLTSDPAAANEPVRPSWLRDEVYPFDSHYANVDGARVHYVDDGSGPVLLLLHGNPTWSFLYRASIRRRLPGTRAAALGGGVSRPPHGHARGRRPLHPRGRGGGNRRGNSRLEAGQGD